jgi:hypothetical protein
MFGRQHKTKDEIRNERKLRKEREEKYSNN